MNRECAFHRGLVMVVLVASCRSAAQPSATLEPVVVTLSPDNVTVAEQRELRAGPAISGTLAASREASIRAEVAGMVRATYVEEGQTVRAGQVLVKIDDSAIRDTWLSSKAALRTANEALLVARRNAERSERLASAGALADRDLEQAKWNTMNAEGSLADAEARLAAAQKQLDRTAVTAGSGGVVSIKSVKVGDVVQVGNPLVTVVDPSSMRLEASVSAQSLATLKVGISVDFAVSGYEGRAFTGQIERINPTADPATRQVRLYVTIPNSGGTLVAGLFAEGRVVSTRKEAVAAPFAAIDNRGTAPVVARVKAGKVERFTVQLGIRDEGAEYVEILNGVAAGDTLLLAAAQGVSSGTSVRVSKDR